MRKWESGRSKTRDLKYFKKLIYSFYIGRYGFDCWILKYEPKGASGYLFPHKDPVSGGRHYRMNIKLWGRAKFYCANKKFSNRIINVFRPDIHAHFLRVYSKTFKLSLGFYKPNKK